jgi:hypothetical protein
LFRSVFRRGVVGQTDSFCHIQHTSNL